VRFVEQRRGMDLSQANRTGGRSSNGNVLEVHGMVQMSDVSVNANCECVALEGKDAPYCTSAFAQPPHMYQNSTSDGRVGQGGAALKGTGERLPTANVIIRLYLKSIRTD